jgi:hypothetical protein
MRAFDFFYSGRMEPMSNIWILLKSLLRSAVDSCILPGTTSSTDILWLYLMEWKKQVSAISFSLLSFTSFALLSFLSTANLPVDSGLLNHRSINESESLR